MVTEKLDVGVRGRYINELEVCKNEENLQISKVLRQTHPQSSASAQGCGCFPAP